MAQIVLTDCFIEIDGEEYSGQGTNVAISYSAEALDVTPFGVGTRKHMGGIKDWSMSFEFNADESVTGQNFFDLVGGVVTVEVRPESDERSATNPAYMGTALVTEYTPLSGAVGEAHIVNLSVVSASPLEREETPSGA